NRKYSQTAYWMISGGNLYLLYIFELAIWILSLMSS
ncbi:MAG: hypothetical protein ACI96M_003375, partial [Candidatus Azotimanducaceae bacterium]